MQKATAIIESQALALPMLERAELVSRLLESLDVRQTGSARDVENAWIDEANRRYQELLRGDDPGLTHEQVFGDLRGENH